jgi:hydroxypyruvate reductase
MLGHLQGLTEDDLVIALISGGESALMVSPTEGLTLADKQAVNAGLLASGAPISQMNVVRKHLSRVKGGQLAAAAWPAPVLSLMISDVPGNDPALIGSGPTVGNDSTPADALAILDRWKIAVPAQVRSALAGPRRVLAPSDGQFRKKAKALSSSGWAAACALARPSASMSWKSGSRFRQARRCSLDRSRSKHAQRNTCASSFRSSASSTARRASCHSGGILRASFTSAHSMKPRASPALPAASRRCAISAAIFGTLRVFGSY